MFYFNSTEINSGQNAACVQLDEAKSGEPSPSLAEDSAAIKVLGQENHKLLCNIETLKKEKEEQKEQYSKEMEGILSSMKEEFVCVICQELFIKAHTLPCSHSFCERCIKVWIRTKRVCPICRKSMSSDPVHSLVLDNAIAQLEAKMSQEDKTERQKIIEKRSKVKPDHTTPSSSASSSNDVTIVEPEVEEIVLSDDESDSEYYESNSQDDENDLNGEFWWGDLSRFVGRCYHCGEFVCVLELIITFFIAGERGHWRPECPYR